MGALIIAGYFDIPEVCVYFNNKLFRGNRVQKLDNSGLDAFSSPNMNPLAHMDIDINGMRFCYSHERYVYATHGFSQLRIRLPKL